MFLHDCNYTAFIILYFGFLIDTITGIFVETFFYQWTYAISTFNYLILLLLLLFLPKSNTLMNILVHTITTVCQTGRILGSELRGQKT